jgi:hypothetical protein
VIFEHPSELQLNINLKALVSRELHSKTQPPTETLSATIYAIRGTLSLGSSRVNTSALCSTVKQVLWSILVVAFTYGYGIAVAASEANLTGADQIPEVATSASGDATINVGPDKSVTGSITTSGIAGTAAHVHVGKVGDSGPPIIALTKTGDDLWSIPAGVVLTDSQFESYKAGQLYVDVHSATHQSGEIRGQISP